ncbi:response regulator transcription factor [Streptomyces sp. NPDC126514]|uniref:helix-turn-helix transcriptional regulator n=1 Tax=Streptomyces sp. NPDC126514 TaxID=3155210 RepID=UPI00332CE091
MTTQIPVFVHAEDPLSEAGLMATLRAHPQILVVTQNGIGDHTVMVGTCEEVGDRRLRALRRMNQLGCQRIVLITDTLAEEELLGAIHAGVCAVLRRAEATGSRLTQSVVRAAEGEGVLPRDLLGQLLQQVAHLRQHAKTSAARRPGLSEREVLVLSLVAEGHDTREIARKLCYSERTVKNVLHDVTSRFNLKNRTQAVAYALRQGLI